ncbi:hypothetical protein [Neiella marina]|nr:hypothetical protein [Neiella marina]
MTREQIKDAVRGVCELRGIKVSANDGNAATIKPAAGRGYINVDHALQDRLISKLEQGDDVELEGSLLHDVSHRQHNNQASRITGRNNIRKLRQRGAIGAIK